MMEIKELKAQLQNIYNAKQISNVNNNLNVNTASSTSNTFNNTNVKVTQIKAKPVNQTHIQVNNTMKVHYKDSPSYKEENESGDENDRSDNSLDYYKKDTKLPANISNNINRNTNKDNMFNITNSNITNNIANANPNPNNITSKKEKTTHPSTYQNPTPLS